MYAVTIAAPGGPDVLTWSEVDDPVPADGEVLIDVAAAGINRADLLQRAGFYPPPPGAPPYPGMEVCGRVAAVGHGTTGWSVGDEVCALIGGGGYAQKATARAEHCLPVPRGVSLIDASGKAFWDPVADRALFDAITSGFRAGPRRKLVRLPHNINDPAFCDALVGAFDEVAGEPALARPQVR